MEKIRVASKNHLCERCNNLISKGSRYYDYWNFTSDENYYHRRFHLGCVKSRKNNSVEQVRPDILERLQKALEKEHGCIIANNNGIKCYVCGIHYHEDGTRDVLCETWGDRVPYYESVDRFKTYLDWNGRYF